MIKTTKNRRGQEEIAGFVAIVVIVSIIGLIFLGLIPGDSGETKESKDERKFLESSMEFTSDCTYSEPNYLSIKDLLKSCFDNSAKSCVNGRTTCETLNFTLIEMIDSTYPIGPDFKRKGLIYSAVYYENSSFREEEVEILTLTKGNCSTQIYLGADYSFAAYPGTITASLKICY